jgi:hypothetical protein
MIASVRGRGERADAHRGLELGWRNSVEGSAARAERRGRAALTEEDDAGASVLLVTVDRLVEIRQWRTWRNSTARASWAWLGLRSRFWEVTGEVAW